MAYESDRIGVSMTRDIAVMCASPPGINPGMACVDRALVEVAARHGFLERVQLFRIRPGVCATLEDPPPTHVYAEVPAGPQWPDRFAAILFWGDFLHMRTYQAAVAQGLVADGSYADRDAALERVQSVFLLRGHAPETLARAMSFGTTLLVNSISDDTHPQYGPLLQRFLRECHDVRCRDVFSALKVSHLRNIYVDSSLGVDCATLANPDLVAVEEPCPAPRLGIHFSRTSHPAYVEQMMACGRELADAIGASPWWLRWGDRVAFPDLAATASVEELPALATFSDRPISNPLEALAGLRACTAIVTDTYHICVNAWNLGVPAICVAQHEFSEMRELKIANYFSRRDKRHVFFSMYDALDFFVSTSELSEPRRRAARVAHIARLLRTGQAAPMIHARVRQHAAAAEQRFVDALMRLLRT